MDIKDKVNEGSMAHLERTGGFAGLPAGGDSNWRFHDEFVAVKEGESRLSLWPLSRNESAENIARPRCARLRPHFPQSSPGRIIAEADLASRALSPRKTQQRISFEAAAESKANDILR
jgi:hypothetical protein